MPLKPNEILIHDTTNNDLAFDVVVDGEVKGRGAVPRDYRVQPKTMFASPSEMQVIPKSEWSARIKEKVRLKSQLSDLRLGAINGQMIPALDQNGQGFCWAYSSGSAQLMLRAAANMPYVRFSPHAVACKIKNFRDEGGWGALSLQWAIEKGYPSEQFWPQKSMSQQYDKAETWANAALHKVTDEWADLTRDVYDRNMTFDMVATCVLNNIPVVVDFNWWSHSVCAIDLVEIESGSFGLRILNSWGDNWSEQGTGVLQGEKTIPNGAVAPINVMASAA